MRNILLTIVSVFWLLASLQPALAKLGSHGPDAQLDERRATKRTPEPTSDPSSEPTPKPTLGLSNFESFFEIEYRTKEGEPDLPLAVQNLATTYNELVQRYLNPLELRMDKVDLLEVETRRKLTEDEIRNLQRNRRVRVVATGTCRGCPTGTQFTNQLTRRERRLSKSSKSGKGHSTSDSYDGYDSYDTYDGYNSYDTYDGYNSYDGHDSNNAENTETAESEIALDTRSSEPPAPPTAPLPTEEELLVAYDSFVMGMDTIITGVEFLDELDGPPEKPFDRAYPDADSDVEYDHAYDHDHGDDHSDSSNSKGSKTSTSGKGKGKGSKKSKSGKGYEYEYESYPYESKGGKGGSGSSKGSKTPKGVHTSCPPVGPAGSFTGDFTSYFNAKYLLQMASNIGVEEAVNELTRAYNRVASRYATSIMMEESFLFDPTSGRQLSYEEVELRRMLKVRRNFNIQVFGFCTGCPQQFTAGNQVSNRRFLDSDSAELDCLLPGLPTAEEVRIEYNLVLDQIYSSNVEKCLALVEIDRPNTGKGKGQGKGKGSSKSSKKSRDDMEDEFGYRRREQ